MVSHWVVGGQFPKTRLSERPLLAESGRSRNLRKESVFCTGTAHLLASHQVVARLVVQRRPMHFCVEVGLITACSSRTPSLRRQKAGQISGHMGFQPGLERLTPLAEA